MFSIIVVFRCYVVSIDYFASYTKKNGIKTRKADDLKRAANKPDQKRIKFGLQNSNPDEPSSSNVGDVHNSPRKPVEIVLRPSKDGDAQIVPPQPPSDDPAVPEIILQPSIEGATENVIQQADDRALELERLLAQPPPPDGNRVTENTQHPEPATYDIGNVINTPTFPILTSIITIRNTLFPKNKRDYFREKL